MNHPQHQHPQFKFVLFSRILHQQVSLCQVLQF